MSYPIFFDQLISVNRLINIKSCDLSGGVLDELFLTYLDEAYLLVGCHVGVGDLDVLVEVFLYVGHAVILELLVVGEYLGNDDLTLGVLLALARVNNYLENTADARDLGFDLP